MLPDIKIKIYHFDGGSELIFLLMVKSNLVVFAATVQ